MKNIHIITIGALGLLLTLSACSKFLDVQPEDKFTQEQLLESESRINMALNGIYLNMGNQSLYGSYLTLSLVECLAQRYNFNNNTRVYYYYTHFSQYYSSSLAEAANGNMWEALYAQALACNDFLDVLEKEQIGIPQSRKNILYGETYALRAFYHFDILRLWGPSSADRSFLSETDSILPYNDTAVPMRLALLPAYVFLEKILEDLRIAEDYLQDDPILTQGIITEATNDPIQDFYINRHYRMNYYAVKAMQARVHLWGGNRDAALEAARAVVEDGKLVQAGELFPWLSPGDIQIGTNPDRVFSSEIMFGVHSANMYSYYDQFFSPTLDVNSELCPMRERLEGLFNGADYRYVYLWREAGGTKDYKVFYKYARPTDRNSETYPVKAEYFQPLIRIAEMHYIIAECLAIGGDLNGAIEHLNKVRTRRGLLAISESMNTSALLEEIANEYAREFFGEGQLYYFYKRRAYSTIPNGTAATGSVSLPYLSVPDSEISLR